MTKWLSRIIMVVLLAAFLMVCTAAYWGYGSQRVGARSLRAGSLNGPQVQGGGPGAGK